mgnify:CR=1 FL=1
MHTEAVQKVRVLAHDLRLPKGSREALVLHTLTLDLGHERVVVDERKAILLEIAPQLSTIGLLMERAILQQPSDHTRGLRRS